MRRAFALTGLALAAPAETPGKFGRLTLEGYRLHEHRTGERLVIQLDGQDVTKHCQEADDVEGWVDVLFPTSMVGELVRAGFPRSMRRFGHVAIVAPPCVYNSTTGAQSISLFYQGWVMIHASDRYLLNFEPPGYGTLTVQIIGVTPAKAGFLARFISGTCIELKDENSDGADHRVEYQIWKSVP